MSPIMTRTSLQITTVNANSFGTLSKYLVDCGSDVVITQEHHASSDKLAEVQGDAQDAGWRGVWCPALATSAGGTEGGVAVLAKTAHHRHPGAAVGQRHHRAW